MIVERTTDKEAIKEIITNPSIWETIAGDDDSIDTYEPPLGENVYVIGYDEFKPIGLFIIHPTSIGLWQCHIQVMPEQREKHAVEFGNKVVQWVWDNTVINKLIALIPEIYPNVKKFSEIQGFKEEGFITNSYSKGGEMFGRWLVAINRGEHGIC